MENNYKNKNEKISSERSFGIVFGVFFLIWGFWPIKNGVSYGVNLAPLLISGGFFGLAIIRPAVLRPLNLIWNKIGQLLHKIVSPIIIGLLFLVLFVPLGCTFRMFGRDLLNRKFSKRPESYWIENVGKSPNSSMKNQY